MVFYMYITTYITSLVFKQYIFYVAGMNCLKCVFCFMYKTMYFNVKYLEGVINGKNSKISKGCISCRKR